MQNAEMILHSTFFLLHFSTLGGEIASRLAYIQKSRGQYLPGRPFENPKSEARRQKTVGYR
jgi:hypothetical protein